MMARPSTPRRRTRKTGFAQGEYYPKVDLSNLDGRLPSSWLSSSVVAPAEEPADEVSVAAAEPAREEEEVMPPPVVYPRIVGLGGGVLAGARRFRAARRGRRRV